MEPVEIEVVRVCAWKQRPCGTCGRPRSNAIHRGHPTKPAECAFKRRNGCERCGQNKLHRDHLGQPPSVNIFGSGNPMQYQAVKKAWHELLVELLEESDLPKGLAGVTVEGEVTFPRPMGHRADQGNSRSTIEKILGDALQAGGFLSNDSWDMYTFGGLEHRHEPGVSRTRLLIFPRAS